MTDAETVVVEVAQLRRGREIGWGDNAVERLRDRFGDVRDAIVAEVRSVTTGLDRLPESGQWRVSEISTKFGVTLTAEAGAIVSKVGGGATFEITATLTREPTPPTAPPPGQ